MSKRTNKKSVLMVVDGHNMLYRGYYATAYAAGGMTNKDGNATGAIKGFMNIFMADFKKIGATHCVVVFDRPGLNFRHRLYPEYKATREKEDGFSLTPQVGPTRKLLKALGVKVIGIKGEEGDDLIGSTATSLEKYFDLVVINSRDKDFASLVTDRIWQMLPKEMPKGIEGVVDRFGVQPSQMIDYLMLVGDKVDNIPGVNNVGDKTATKLLIEYGSLKNIVKNKDKLTPGLRKNIEAAVPQFKLTKKLVTIATDRLPDLTKTDAALQGVDVEVLESICDGLDFRTTYQQMLKFRGL